MKIFRLKVGKRANYASIKAILLLQLFTWISLDSSAQCEFTIAPPTASFGCYSTSERIVFTDVSNSSITGSKITKTSGGSSWNAGFASTASVFDNGYLSFQTSENNTAKFVGLSSTNTNDGVGAIEYAFYLRGNGNYEIRENNVSKTSQDAYTSSTAFRIAVEDGVVKYYKNNNVIYISDNVPTLPLILDGSIYSEGGTVNTIRVNNLSDGAITAFTPSGGEGISPVYKWFLNSVEVGSNSSVYDGPSLNDGDELYCELTPGSGGCSASPQNSNLIEIGSRTEFNYGSLVIQGQVSSTACNTVDEEVVWRQSELQNVKTQASANNIIKIQSDNTWDGGAASWNEVSDNGYFQFQTSENNRAKFVGLSSSNSGDNHTTIEYAIYLRANGNFEIRENNVTRTSQESYTSSTVFKISVEGGEVKYYKNNNLVYISDAAPTLPLIADVSIYDTDGTVTNAVMSNYNTGVFTATTENAGTNPTYQWQLNGSDVGTNSSTYTNTALSDGDEITCIMMPDLDGCSSISYTSNMITNRVVTNNTSIDFAIRGEVSATACNTVDEEVVWRQSELQNVKTQASANNIIKIQSDNSYDGGAASWNEVSDNGYFQFQTSENNRAKFVGLSTANGGDNHTTIEYAIYLRANGNFEVRENNVSKTSQESYTSSTVFKISVEGGEVKYYKNNNLVYISDAAPTLPLIADVSIYDTDGTVTNAVMSNYNTGVFTATTENAGTNPTYQWQLNGSDVGTNSSTYTNTALSDGDEITCIMMPDLDGCSSISYTSNMITNRVVTNNTSIDFAIRGEVSATACNTVDEEVVWRQSELQNVKTQASANNIIKIQSDNSYDGGAASWNEVSDNGYFQFQTSENNRAKFVGLSTANGGDNHTTIEYAIYLRANGNFEVRENNVSKTSQESYTSSTVFKISVEGGEVKYYKNNNLVYISDAAPTLPLIADVSIYDTDGTVTNAVMSNYNTGVFTATTENAGTNPTYQWQLNGSDVGTNSSTYTNTALSDGDEITCIMMPDLDGCSSISYTSNMITNRVVTNNTSIDFAIRGEVSATACNTVDEEVVWRQSELQNVKTQASANNIIKIQSDNSYDGGAASWNEVSDNGYFQFQTSENNRQKFVGLSSSNSGDNHTSIQYAFFLRANGNYEVRENNVSRTSQASYSNATVFRIAIESGVVKYYRNNTLVYTSNIAPTLPLIADVSIYDTGGTVVNSIVSNPNTGDYLAEQVNGGINPTYQWQVNGIDMGVNSPNYSNAGLSGGDEVTCLLIPDIDGCSNVTYTSNTITFNDPGTPNTWLGVNSNSWNDPTNWSDGTPDLFSSVTIPAGTPNNPVLSNSGIAYDLIIEAGATFEISGSNSLDLYRDFTNNGTFIPNTSTVNFVSCSHSNKVNSLGVTQFYNLSINTDVYSEILSGNIEILNQLTLNNGVIYQNSDLLIVDGASVAAANANSFVDGPLSKAGSSDFEFPIGDNGVWAPAAVANLSASDTYTAEYFFNVFSDTTTKASDPLAYISEIEYWDIDRTGSTSANLTLKWKDRDRSKINDAGDLVIAHYDGADWESMGQDVIDYGLEGSITINNVTSFSPFTFGSLSIDRDINPLPIELISFEANESNGQVLLSWSTATETNNDFFTIERSADAKDWIELTQIDGAGDSKTRLDYQHLDKYPNQGQNYYRLKQTDFDGTQSYSDIVVVLVELPIERELLIYPNPTSGKIILKGDQIGEVPIKLINSFGQVEIINPISQSDNTMEFNLTGLPGGMYLIEINGTRHKIIKM